jgi:hypothetical protein
VGIVQNSTMNLGGVIETINAARCEPKGSNYPSMAGRSVYSENHGDRHTAPRGVAHEGIRRDESFLDGGKSVASPPSKTICHRLSPEG